MPHLELAVVALTAACILILPLILLVTLGTWRRLRQVAARADMADDTQLDAIAARLADRQATAAGPALEQLSTQMTEMRRDFDWLVSDRMIEQAIEMAKAGEESNHITTRTGISDAELAAMTRLRQH